jgi:hypothetical protein
MKKQMPPPSNWQDFEDLCKRLFGEMWKCPHTIRKHGRNGQHQCGVDVYGIPEGETQLFGVQCKGKDNNLGKGLTEKEVDKEIDNAKKFDPPLKTFVIATSAPPDVTIEKYILKKSLASFAEGGFQILLYDWEDLTDAIRRNKNTYNFYILNRQFEDENSVGIKFNGELVEAVVKPKFLRTRIFYNVESEEMVPYQVKVDVKPTMMKLVQQMSASRKKNHSWIKIETTIDNNGNLAIEDWKLYLHFDSDTRVIDNDEPSGPMGIEIPNLTRVTHVFEEEMQILYEPLDSRVFVPKDGRVFSWWMIPQIEAKEVIVRWELLSRNYSAEGEVKLIVQPEFEEAEKHVTVETLSEERIDVKITELIK